MPSAFCQLPRIYLQLRILSRTTKSMNFTAASSHGLLDVYWAPRTPQPENGTFAVTYLKPRLSAPSYPSQKIATLYFQLLRCANSLLSLTLTFYHIIKFIRPLALTAKIIQNSDNSFCSSAAILVPATTVLHLFSPLS